MEFEDTLIYLKFRKELRLYIDAPYDGIGKSKYERFIDSLDLGIKYKRILDNGTDIYEITDEKKWFLNKIKYGI
jgi:hypothetical protein